MCIGCQHSQMLLTLTPATLGGSRENHGALPRFDRERMQLSVIALAARAPTPTPT